MVEAMYTILCKSVGLTKEQLCSECARAYNFQRMTQTFLRQLMMPSML